MRKVDICADIKKYVNFLFRYQIAIIQACAE